MKNILLILFTVITLLSCNAQKTEGVERITLETLKTNVIGKDLQFVDIRTPEEFNNGHIDDAVNINFFNVENFKTEIVKYNKSEPIYIYCKSGARSNKASKLLKELGFKTIYDFSGGWKAWSQQ